MGHERTLARGARVFGALVLAVLALFNLVWIIRDFTKANEVLDVWWMWCGQATRASDGVWVTSFADPTLLVLYVIAAVTALRSSTAASLLVSTGTLTVLLRLPGLWNLNSDRMRVIESDLKNQVLYSTVLMVVLGAALVVAAAAGRRPDGGLSPYAPTGPGYARPVPHSRDEPPARPTPGGAVLGFLLLGAVVLTLVAWEIYFWQEMGWSRYSSALTGEHTIRLLEVPYSWFTWTVVLLSLIAAGVALTRAPCARSLGMTLSSAVLGLGVTTTAASLKLEYFEHFGELETLDQLHVLTNVFAVLAGVGVLAALAPREESGPAPLPFPPGGPSGYAAPLPSGSPGSPEPAPRGGAYGARQPGPPPGW
ncbi:hypothetical protein E0L36_11015 [Streptomyces sp. AJS327]|uniref:hypothetical protein n=1 Tax=Streptomyces sp. AJS327 TaxID=2545265 RepID=UPI0015E02D48|nr:hypothetical protein [Streptomyces sp. AJS327]MBA0051400.1 hypothetical protein [Streptomyces sp. AJS327]